VSNELERGRESYKNRAWADAHDSLARADRETLLDVADLERLAFSAYLVGQEEEFLKVLDRAHHAHLDAGKKESAARCAFWSGLCLLFRGETGPATGWLGRAKRLLENRDCVDQGYLLLPVAEQQLIKGDLDTAYANAVDAASIADRFGDLDLAACAHHLEGRVLIRQGKVRNGLALLDEAMVAVIAGEISPIMTGLIYCSVIETCQQAYVLNRAREWTSALTQWCELQPEMVAFTTRCLVHRAEIMQLSGDWPNAIEAAQRACEREKPPAEAYYQQAEVYRLRGEYSVAEEAYRKASQMGREPQPGLSLLRMAQGQIDSASRAIRRVMSATTAVTQRVNLLPAYIEISLAAGDIEEARIACGELEAIAKRFDTDVLAAMVAHARGAVEFADGDARSSLGSLRHSWQLWQQVAVPYEAARVRTLIGLACRALGDNEGFQLELEAAKSEFDRLGAAREFERIDSLIDHTSPTHPQLLTQRELQVLRMVATGKTNKAIATELYISQKTIDRHVSNIFAKLNVASRAAATAYAYEHKLV
jgi:ATP/maltotriose-dependent transcriptional regulator MalT